MDVFRTPDRTAQALLTPEQFRIQAAIAERGNRSLPLRLLAARAGLDSTPDWVTIEAKDRRLNLSTLSASFQRTGFLPASRFFVSRQPKSARVKVFLKP